MPEYAPIEKAPTLFQADVILPTQYFAALQHKGGSEPERQLARAVLRDAIECFQKYLQARNRKQRKLFLEAEQWISDEDRSWPFSFENICDLLKIDPHYLRYGLFAWKAQHVN